MAKERELFCYELRYGSQVVYIGIAPDLTEAEKQHREEGLDYTSVVQIGLRLPKEEAEAWLEERLADYRRTHRGQNPRFNQAVAA
ncbi:MAG: hypothetical protein FJZ90_18240 [Chloroflexi bacterium]|nr:hypothetical protein [Chloroflexota bacterium]